ncbi:MAG: DUF86 domain-containing protein [Deltaproteobacteria bacterium]|nr:DUF86 domain-containing protein [Deltaproteobacteria bacterium]
MPCNEDITRLRHMLESALDAVSFVQNRNRSSLDTNKMLQLAIVRCIEIIGEAASKISKECCDAHPQIPWKNIVNMRNRLIHAYFDINLDTVWSAATKDLPPLISELQKILGPDGRE